MPILDSDSLKHMFDLTLLVSEKMARPILVYIFLVVALRIFGKRELAQLNPFDLVVLLSLANTVQNAIIGDDNSVTGGMIGAATLLAFNYLVIRFLFGHRRLDQIIEGKPLDLIANGHISHKALAKELMTENELLTVIRKEGFHKLNEVETCVMQANGTFYVEGKEPSRADQQHAQLMDKINELSLQVSALKRA